MSESWVQLIVGGYIYEITIIWNNFDLYPIQGKITELKSLSEGRLMRDADYLTDLG